jgi:hypothetical protein
MEARRERDLTEMFVPDPVVQGPRSLQVQTTATMERTIQIIIDLPAQLVQGSNPNIRYLVRTPPLAPQGYEAILLRNNEAYVRAGYRLVQAGDPNTVTNFRILFYGDMEDSGERRYITFVPTAVRTSSEEEIVQQFKRFDENHAYDLSVHSLKINVIEPLQSGGCGADDVRESIKDFLPKCRIWLRSPKSANDNCSIMCFIKALGLKGNQVKPDTIRKACDLPATGPVHHEQIPRIARHFQSSCRVYVHPLRNENDARHEYIHNETARLIHVHLIEGHYWIEHKERTSNFACVECGAGLSVDPKSGRRQYKRGTLGQTRCEHCNPATRSYYKTKVKGKKIVGHVSLKSQDIRDPKTIIYFDLETLRGEKNKCLPYAVGFMRGDEVEPHIEYGQDCLSRFLTWVMSHEEQMCLVAHNGARFDHHLLVDEILRSQVPFERKSVVMSNGRILSFEFGDLKHNLWDLYLFTMASLDDTCKALGTLIQKGDFDHDKIKTWEDTEKHRDEIVKYLRKDVLGLQQSAEVFAVGVHEKSGLSVFNFMTLSQMAYHNWRKTRAQDNEAEDEMAFNEIHYDYDAEQYRMICKAKYGGRVYPCLKHFKSTVQEQEWEKVYASKDYLFAADVVSLYPAAMRGTKFLTPRYPVGPHRWSDNPETDFRQGLLGIFHVHVVPPRHITEPVLPHHKMGGGLDWPLDPFEDTFTSVDLINAEQMGYQITFIGRAMVWDQSCDTLFKSYVDTWFLEKRKAKAEKNNVMYMIAKIMMNALYGKLLQKPHTDAKLWTNDTNEAIHFLADKEIVDMFHYEKADLWMIDANKLERNIPNLISKPMHLGAFVLSYSRSIMLHYARMIDPSLTRPVKAYGDTDSMFIRGEDHQLLMGMGVFGEDIGDLDNDLKEDALITHFVAHQPKTYHALAVTRKDSVVIKMGAKGIPAKRKAKPGEKIRLPSYPGQEPEYQEAEGGEKMYILHHEDFVCGQAKQVSFTTFDRIGVKRGHKEDPFTILIYETDRKFLGSEWKGFDFDGTWWRPKGYRPLIDEDSKIPARA